MNVGELLPLPGLDGHRDRVEADLRDAVAGQDPFLTEIATHLISAGGHRWRPILTLGCAQIAGGEVTPEVIRGACAVELVHLGSLYHDDVMDEADSRRGVVSVNARWGNLVAILAGDYLLARASELAASLGTDVAALLAQTIGRLCEGQVLELKEAFQPGRSEDAYFGAVAGKTAALFATSCRIGALCAGLPAVEVEALTSYGTAFGVVYQIVDDVSDLTLTEKELGKPAGHDMVEGVYTLPVIRALTMAEVGDELRPLLTPNIGRPEADKAIEIIRASGAIESALLVARDYADQAAAALAGFPRGGVVDTLRAFGHRVLDHLSVA